MGKIIINFVIAIAIKIAHFSAAYSFVFYLEEPTIPESIKFRTLK